MEVEKVLFYVRTDRVASRGPHFVAAGPYKESSRKAEVYLEPSKAPPQK